MRALAWTPARLPACRGEGLSHADRVSMFPLTLGGSNACSDRRFPGARLFRELRFLQLHFGFHLGRRLWADQPDAGESKDHGNGQWPCPRGGRGLPKKLHCFIRRGDPGESGRRSRFGSILRLVVGCVRWDGNVRSDLGRRPGAERYLRDAASSSAEPAPPERDRPGERSRDLLARRAGLRFLDLCRRFRRRHVGDAHGHRG